MTSFRELSHMKDLKFYWDASLDSLFKDLKKNIVQKIEEEVKTFKMNRTTCLLTGIMYCRNFGKELVILFHRTAAAPWGHVASIIKRSSTGDSPSFGSTPTTVSNRSFS